MSWVSSSAGRSAMGVRAPDGVGALRRVLERRSGVRLFASEHLGDVADALAQGRGVDPVLGVVGDLDVAPAVGLVDRQRHRVRDGVRVHVHLAGHVARRAADGLDQRRPGTQEALLVRVEDAHERHLGKVEALAQQVDAHKHVEAPHAQFPQQLHAAQRVDIRVEVLDAHAPLGEVLREVLRHLLGERGDEHALVSLDRSRICSKRSSIWPSVGLTTICGSTSPVGRMICWTTPSASSSSYLPGVAER